MKILILILFSLFNKISFKSVLTFGGIILIENCKSQSPAYTSGGNTGNNSWSVYLTNSPTNIYGNRYNCVNINRDSIVLRTKYIMMDSISNNNFPVLIGAKFAWLDGRQLKISKIDSLPISARQITTGLTYTPLQLEVDGSITNEIQNLSLTGQTISLSGANSIVIPTQTVPLTAQQITTALGAIPLFSQTPQILTYTSNILQLTNGGTVNITPTLSASNINTGLGYIPLQTEVDGSIINEIQSLSLSGQSLSISGANSIVIPTQTVPLTSAQVTTALGFVPATNTVVSDKTVTILSTNTVLLNVTSSYPGFTITPYSTTTQTVTRSINSTTFQCSATKTAWVYYTIRINCVATIGSTSSGTVALQYSSDNGSTWNDVGQVENSNTVTLAIILNSNTTQTSQLSGIIPSGAIIRMVTTNNGATITYVRGQETY